MASNRANDVRLSGDSEGRPKYHIRPMKDEDVSRVLQIWGDNNLHEGTHTIQSFLKVDPEGFVVAVDDRTGRVLGMCAGVFVNPETAFIGLYGVDPQYQKLGIGMSMWRKIMEHVGDRNAGLYAVPEHLAMYRDKAGFKWRDNKQLYIYESDTVRTRDLVKSLDGIHVDKIDDSLLERVVQYDEHVHRYSRAALLANVFAEENTIALAAIDEYDDTVVGYGCFRTNNAGKAMAGPLYADNDAVAEFIIYQIVKSFPIAETNGLLYMTLDSNPGGIRIAEKLGLQKHEELPRFFTKFAYDSALWSKVYCIHSPNFAIF